MSNFVSKEGVWHPAKERIALRNVTNETIKNPSAEYSKYHDEEVKPGEQYIYEGEDRAALFELWKEKIETKGTNFRTEPMFLQSIRNQGFTTVNAYLKSIGYDQEKSDKEFKDKAVKVTRHEVDTRTAAVEIAGGGIDTAGVAEKRLGGFGEAPKVG